MLNLNYLHCDKKNILCSCKKLAVPAASLVLEIILSDI